MNPSQVNFLRKCGARQDSRPKNIERDRGFLFDHHSNHNWFCLICSRGQTIKQTHVHIGNTIKERLFAWAVSRTMTDCWLRSFIWVTQPSNANKGARESSDKVSAVFDNQRVVTPGMEPIDWQDIVPSTTFWIVTHCQLRRMARVVECAIE